MTRRKEMDTRGLGDFAEDLIATSIATVAFAVVVVWMLHEWSIQPVEQYNAHGECVVLLYPDREEPCGPPLDPPLGESVAER